MMKNRLKEVIESLIFISLEPLTLEKIKNVLQEYPEEQVELAIKELLESYVTNERGIQIIQSAGGYLFSTSAEHDLWIRRLFKLERKAKLSSAEAGKKSQAIFCSTRGFVSHRLPPACNSG
jgi:segregation and condensation protein B